MTVSAAEIAALINDSGTTATVTEADYETPLSDLGVDSLDIATIFLAIQEKLGVKVTDDEIDRLTTVNLIAKRVSEG